MNTFQTLVAALAALSLGPAAFAGPSVNDMQGCQALIDFMDAKLAAAPDKYDGGDIETAREGLKVYNAFIQNDIVTPGLLESNGDDAAKAKAMQTQANDYKNTVIAGYKKKYTDDKLYTDWTMSLNGCANKARPQGDDLIALKAGFDALLRLNLTK